MEDQVTLPAPNDDYSRTYPTTTTTTQYLENCQPVQQKHVSIMAHTNPMVWDCIQGVSQKT